MSAETLNNQNGGNPEESAPWDGGIYIKVSEQGVQIRPLDEVLAGSEVDRSKEVFRLSRNPDTYEVTVESKLTLEDWEEITPAEDWALMLEKVDSLKEELKDKENKSVVFINPTMEGGGVAMMRPPLIHMLRLNGIDAHWFVMEKPDVENGEPNVFVHTKGMHNTIQRRPEGKGISEEGKIIHKNWSDKNAEVLLQQDPIRNGAIVVLDDPQPGHLAGPIKEVNPGVMLLQRNHIDNDGDLAEDPSTLPGQVHKYLQEECGWGELVDAYIYHPDIHNKFIPKSLRHKTYLAPATIEAHDDMNRELSPEERKEGIASLNDQIERWNEQCIKEGRPEDVQALVDVNRDRIVQIARFDESKEGDKAMEIGTLTREMVMEMRQAMGDDSESVQTIIIGNGSVDDPSGERELEKLLELRRQLPEDIRKDVIIQRLVHNYVAINAMMYNDNPDVVLLGMQASIAEGCETRITDWIDHGIPMFVRNVGGMPLQVIEEESGLIFDTNDPNKGIEYSAKRASDLIVNRDKYRAMRESTYAAAQKLNRREYCTTANVTRFADIFANVLKGNPAHKQYKITEMVEEGQVRRRNAAQNIAELGLAA